MLISIFKAFAGLGPSQNISTQLNFSYSFPILIVKITFMYNREFTGCWTEKQRRSFLFKL